MIWALVLVPALSGLAIWSAGDRGRAALGTPAVGAASLTLVVAMLAGGTSGRYAWADGLALTATLPPLAQAVAITVSAVAVAVLLFAAVHEDRRGLARLLGLLLLFVAGMQLVVVADDLVALLIGWEIVGACSWALIGHRWREPAPCRSANYAFVMTRAGDLGLFVAVFATYAGTGAAGYADLGALDGPPLTLAAGGLLVAALSKAGQVPFAPWLFRAMDGPTSVSALLHSATMVAAGVYLLARLQPALGTAAGFGVTAMAIGLTTAILGGIVALRQVQAKKVLAGSTSAQMGLMIATVGAGFPGIAILHLVVHAAMKAALFFAAGIAQRATGDHDLRRMRLGNTMPVAAGLTAVAALSLAALPPLAGGWTKEAMIKALEQPGPWTALAAILAGGLSAAYATRFAWLAFGPGRARNAPRLHGQVGAMGLLVAGVAVLSALWLPPVHEPITLTLGATLPHGSMLGLVASLVAVAIGVVAGLRAARTPGMPPRRDWLGLPRLVETVVTHPFSVLARVAAQIDDGYVDWIPHGTAVAARNVSARLALADDRGIDGLAPGTTDPAESPRTRSWRGAVGSTVALTGAFARVLGRHGEALSDLLASGSGRAVATAGASLRRAQTGLAHHYYVILIGGLVLGMVVLILGA